MPLILGTLNLLGMYTYPLGTNFFFILFFVFMVLLAAYFSKPSVGGTYHFGSEGTESVNFTDFAGRSLSIFIALLETVGYYTPLLFTMVRLTAYAASLSVLLGLFSHPSNAPRLAPHLPLLIFTLEVGCAALIVETQNLFYLFVRYIVAPMFEEFLVWYFQNSELK